MNELDSRTAKRIASIKATISAKGMTAYEVAAAIYLNRTSASRYLTHLVETGRAHICGWHHPSHTPAAIYLWGAGENVPRPIPMSAAEGQRAYRERFRKDPIANALFLARVRGNERAREIAKRSRKKPQNPFSALFVGVRGSSLNAEG